MRRLLLIILFLFPANLFGQFDVPDELKNATVVISTESCSGSGSVIEKDGVKFVLTAAHCVCKDSDGNHYSSIKVSFFTGETIEMEVAVCNSDSDIAILRGNIPVSVPSLPISDELVKPNDEIKMLVRSGASLDWNDVQIRLGIAAINSGYKNFPIGNYKFPKDADYQLHLDSWVQPGDSGSPVLNSKDQIVGVVSASLRPSMLVTNGRGEIVRALWPCFCVAHGAIKPILDGLETKSATAEQTSKVFKTYAEFVEIVKQKPGTYYLLITADWCAPCQRLKQQILAVSPKTTIFICDYDKDTEAAKTFLKGRGIPYFLKVTVKTPKFIESIVPYTGGDLKKFLGE